MNSDDERLRRAFAAGSERAAGDCPAPDQLWAAAAGELPPAERRAVIDHTSRCAACAEDFRIVAAMAREAPATRPAPAPGRVVAGPWLTRERRWLAGSLAAMLLIGVLVAGIWNREPEVQRGGDAEIVSLLGEEARLSSENAVLRWQGPPSARFAVTVTTRDLRLVDEVTDLEVSAYRLPPEKLAGLVPGTALDWRVEALLPDGRRLSSPLFTFLLAP